MARPWAMLMARAGRPLAGYADWRASGLSGDALETAVAFAQESAFADASRPTGAELLASIQERVVDGVLAAELRRWATEASPETIAAVWGPGSLAGARHTLHGSRTGWGGPS